MSQASLAIKCWPLFMPACRSVCPLCQRRTPLSVRSSGPGPTSPLPLAAGRWIRAGDQPVHYLASTPTVAWAEWIRHQELHDPDDLLGVSAALWAVMIPIDWT